MSNLRKALEEARELIYLAVDPMEFNGVDTALNHIDAALAAAAPEPPASDAMRERIIAVLTPFARIAEHDIGESETDQDRYRPISVPANRRAPALTVGDLRRAAALLAELTGTGGTTP